mmetsp:Transcript_18293/g.29763  ORF Transcript_18293/g.29763 Transcript_18293/m.29763 type:complete len:310 (-) Transcript_18293:906-1835(-)
MLRSLRSYVFTGVTLLVLFSIWSNVWTRSPTVQVVTRYRAGGKNVVRVEKPPAIEEPLQETAQIFTTGRHLIISYYAGTYSDARILEIQGVITENIKNRYIQNVHIFCEACNGTTPLFLQNFCEGKVVMYHVETQPTYKDFFGYANRYLARGTIAIISNSDIVIGEKIKCAANVDAVKHPVVFPSETKRLILALSRFPSPCVTVPPEGNECLQYRGSHDTFVFAPPLSQAFVGQVDFIQNLLGAENRLLWHLKNASYRVSNPCRLFHVQHRHCAKRSRKVQGKRFAKRGDGKYASVDPFTQVVCGTAIY